MVKVPHGVKDRAAVLQLLCLLSCESARTVMMLSYYIIQAPGSLLAQQSCLYLSLHTIACVFVRVAPGFVTGPVPAFDTVKLAGGYQ